MTNQATPHLRLLCSFKGKQSEREEERRLKASAVQFLLGGYRAEKQLCINKAHQSLEKWGAAYRNIIHCRICLAHKIMVTDYDSCVACFCHHFERRKKKVARYNSLHCSTSGCSQQETRCSRSKQMTLTWKKRVWILSEADLNRAFLSRSEFQSFQLELQGFFWWVNILNYVNINEQSSVPALLHSTDAQY